MRPRALAVFIGDTDNESDAGVDFAFQILHRHTDRHTGIYTDTGTHTDTATGTHIAHAYLGCDMERHLLFVYPMCLLYSSIALFKSKVSYSR